MTWDVLLDVLILLTAALVLGALFERLRQSAILGYLLAGTALGPNALDLIRSEGSVETLAELGIALLLFTIGLEFSWRRLMRMGPTTAATGVLQIVVTLAIGTAVALALGQGVAASVAIGAVVALSSTAFVLRLLVSRTEIDSMHGRHALGILLIQDLAVVPLVILVDALNQGGGTASVSGAVARTLLLGAVLILVFVFLFNFVVPHILGSAAIQRYRELPILLAVVVGFGSAIVADKMSLPPAIGAFVAGMLLAESPFATQVRADIAPLRTLLVTLFFSSIGMIGDPVWIINNWLMLLVVVVAVVIGKSLLIWGILSLFRRTRNSALTAGICLAQVGEFSFVMAEVAHDGIFDEHMFQLVVSVSIGTLFLTPYLVGSAARIETRVSQMMARSGLVDRRRPAPDHAPPADHVIIIGFGPAGQAVAETLIRQQVEMIVVDLNSRAISVAERYDLRAYVGNAGQADVLEHLGVASAAAIIITIPDPSSARQIIRQVRATAPDTPLFVRCRYHVYRWELEFAGGNVIVDEEQHVGRRLGAEVRKALRHRRDGGDEPATTA